MGRVAIAVALLCAAVAGARPHVGPVPLPPNVLAPRRAFAFDAMRIKAVQPDFYNASVIAQYNAGGVAANFVWADWEPALVPAPCPDPHAQVEYDGHCFAVQTDVDGVVSAYSLAHNMNVHANVYGSPAWAATDPNCQPANGAIFCAPDNASDFARFAGFIAWRYGLPPNASGSNGYINSFAVWNEVNTNAYFNAGCGSQGGAVPPCDVTGWVARYAELWTAAYDSITSENADAMVEACFDHSFEADAFDKPTAAAPTISVQTFLTTLMPQIGADRVLRIAYHPYTTDLRTPTFSPDDFPYVTYGNLGALGGWLLSQWPERTELWNEISLTESGINSAAPESSNGAQANGVCQSFWNAIGTPGIVNYVYHRMVDNAQEGGLLLGLVDESGAFKTSWSAWSQCNYQRLSCGFGNLPNTKLQRSKSATRNHWVSTRLPPATYSFEKAWFLWRDPQFNATTGEPQTVPIFECLVGPIGGGGGNLLSFNPNCEPPSAGVPLGLVGYAYTPANANAQKFLVPLYRCVTTANIADHFVSGDSACEGQTTEALLGYVLPAGF